jgi:hypothetical protein
MMQGGQVTDLPYFAFRAAPGKLDDFHSPILGRRMPCLYKPLTILSRREINT